MSIRNRVVGQQMIAAADLVPHPHNPRTHQNDQRAVIRGILNEIGQAGTLLVYKSERESGRYVIIDGHLRAADYPIEWPCTVVDLDDREADLLIQAYDEVGRMALTDTEKLKLLRERVEFQDASVRHMLDTKEPTDSCKDEEAEKKKKANKVPEMELLPYEHYDYLMVLFRTTFDWNIVCDRLEIRRVQGTNDKRYKGKVGLARAVPGEKLLDYIKRCEEAEARIEELEEELRRLRGEDEAAPGEDDTASEDVAPRRSSSDEDFAKAKREMV